MLGGMAGIVGVRRGDKLSVFVQAGIGVFVVQAMVVLTFALLGDQDVRGVLELVGAAAVSAGGATVAAVGSFAVIGSRVRDRDRVPAPRAGEPVPAAPAPAPRGDARHLPPLA